MTTRSRLAALEGEVRYLESARAVLAMCQSIPRWYHAEGNMAPEVVAAKYSEIALTAVGYVSAAAKPRKRAPSTPT
ncbi:Uncharacterised protein [Mycobacteroides abscessus subsp. abscessus]|nr:Uncharacterised protein [Mycobacteroides abscessus subsp. abscessus]